MFKRISILLLAGFLLIINRDNVLAGTYQCKYDDTYGCLVDTNNCDPQTETLYHEQCGPINDKNKCNISSFQCDKRDNSNNSSTSNNNSTSATTTNNSNTNTATTTNPAPASAPQPVPQKDAPDKPIACNQIRPDLLHPYIPGLNKNIEFHSLRPYQASPCNINIEQTSRLCGNDMTLIDTIKVEPYDSHSSNCVENGSTLTCDYIYPRGFMVIADASTSQLPIAGNTELVPNSQSTQNQLDSAQRVNDYLSWYLNGVVNRAEEPFLSYKLTDDIQTLIDFSGPIRKLIPFRIQSEAREQQISQAGKTRHNQAAACSISVPLVSSVFKALNFPVPCYSSLITNIISGYVRVATWKNHTPPKEENTKNFLDYYKKLKNWSGNICPSITIPKSIPLVGGKTFMLCLRNPLATNYGSLFSFIPFSSTEDRVGQLSVGIPTGGGEVEVLNPNFDGKTTANLYFPHMQETSELSTLLQGSYIPKDLQGGQTLDETKPPDISLQCKILEARSNPGDKLFGESTLGQFSYTAKFKCTYSIKYDQFGFKYYDPSPCVKTATFNSKINVDTPLIDDIWTKLVAGNAAAFKRLFPELQSSGLGVVLDIPAVSPVVYRSAPYITDAAGVGPASPEIYFPHLGGVQEYFLKGIQTLLRPKGFGEEIVFSPNTPANGNSATDCKNASPQNVSGLISKEAFATMAGPGSRATECYDYVVGRAIKEGIDPALALWVWLNESRASNYNLSDHDFGVKGDLDRDIVGQMGEFIRYKKLLTAAHVPECAQYGVTDDLLAFATLYFTGSCNPDKIVTGYQGKPYSGRDYYNLMVSGIAALKK